MGICLDTEKNKDETEDIEGAWVTQSSKNVGAGYPTSAISQSLELIEQNVPVNFEKPKVPVIFVLGGPGSGKVTHCDNLSDEKRGVIHINITDLMQQYSAGNDGKNYNEISSKMITEVLMLEMKMSPAAKTFLVSGYPRNMRDVVEYHEKITAINGVILLAWRQSMLEKQIEYGAKLGHVILHFARMELTNFFQNVTPVADYFDQRGMLIVINGERNPAEVYNDFRTAVLRILSAQNSTNIVKINENTNIIPNKPIKVNPINKTIINPSVSKNLIVTHATVNPEPPDTSITTTSDSVYNQLSDNSNYPDIIYVVGGPGSNKAHLCQTVLHRMPNWAHISVGSLLRAKVDLRDIPMDEAQLLKDNITTGEFVNPKIVADILRKAMLANMNSNGIVIDGFPRNMDQLHEFEDEYQQHPQLILLDCSKLQLGRGRWDDSVSAFRKRLELFREQTLPMLKILDTEHRLTMIDGDTDTTEVQEEFTIALVNLIQKTSEESDYDKNRRKSSVNMGAAVILQDLEDEISETNIIKPIATPAQMMNGYGPPRDRKTPSGSKKFLIPTSSRRTSTSENIFKINAQVENYSENKNN